MSGSLFIKTILSDIEDIRDDFEKAKDEIESAISTQSTEIETLDANKQEKINVLSDISLKNVNVLTLNSTPVSSVLDMIPQVSEITDVVNEFYDNTSKVITATTVNCANLILNSIPFSSFSTNPISGQIIKKTIIYKKDFQYANNIVPKLTEAKLIASAKYGNYLGNHLLIEYGINEYNLSGTRGDSLTAYLQIVRDGVVSESYRTRQNWREMDGGGTRSGTILPLIYFLNEERPLKISSILTTDVTLNVYVGTGSTDDIFSYDSHGMGSYFIVTEIAP